MAESETCLQKGIDRISSLPKPLISRILSQLPTQNAVATSLLSTRWRFLWTSIDSIDIVDKDFFGRLPKMSLDMKYKIFTKFVNRVLLLLNSPCIQDFCLKLCCEDLWDPFYLNSWVSAAFGRTARTLILSLSLAKPIELPLSRYCTSNPDDLSLVGSIHVNVAASSSICFSNLVVFYLSKVTFTIASNCSVSFPSLKKLLLICVRYGNEESANKLLASCPVLDNLHIVRYGSDNVGSFVISIPSLRRLDLVFLKVHKLHIAAPSLKFLSLKVLSSNVLFSVESLSSLLEAKLKLNFLTNARQYVNNFIKFMQALVNVKFLSISGGVLKAIGSKSANILISPGFLNLSRLKLSKYSCPMWPYLVNNLLKSSVNLEHIIIKGCYGIHESWWTETLHVPICLLLRVTTVSFKNMIGNCSGELELVRFFLKNAKVLQLLTVHISGDSAASLKLMRKISMMPRRSQACQVAFEGLEEDDESVE